MKHSLMIAGIVLAAFSANGQNNSLVFSADGKDYTRIHNATPRSEIDFYSKTGGGKRIAVVPVSHDGVAIYQGAIPAFGLNAARQSQNGNAGNGKVTFMEGKAFTFSNFSLEGTAVQWQCDVANPDIKFNLLSSNNGKHFTQLVVMDATPGQSQYSIPEVHTEGTSYYQLQILAHGQIVYTTGILANNQNHKIAIYPTTTTGTLTVSVDNAHTQQPYKIISTDGRVISQGVFADRVNQVSVTTLAAGNYYVVTGKANERVGRFVKY